MQQPGPRLTIGIPTFNRSEGLRRAVLSATAQTYSEVRIVIADNASTDDTAAVCAELVRDHPNVEVVRHGRNRGLTANFNSIFDSAATEYLMVLADDDTIDPYWAQGCVAALDADPELAICSGNVRFERPDGSTFGGNAFDVTDTDPHLRLKHYFREVTDNVTIYGVMRVSALQHALPMRNVLAGDWLLCARMLAAGTMRVLPTTFLTRSDAGTSADLASMARSMEVGRIQRHVPTLYIAGAVARVIASTPTLGARRWLTALRCAELVLRHRWLGVIEDIVGPVLRHRRMARVDGLVRRVAQRWRG